MPDVKPEIKAENQPALAEKPLAGVESLKSKLETGAEKAKIENLDAARKMVISEIERMENQAPAAIGPVAGVSVPPAKQQKQIENVLAQGLNDVYLSLAPVKRLEFKRVGEETARKINLLLAKTKINIGEIIRLIKKWLSLIPGINKYFLEQEAKIKADEIIKMKK